MIQQQNTSKETVKIFNFPDERITSRISSITLGKIVMAIEEGYKAADLAIKSIDFLRVPTAINRHQDIFNFAVDHFLMSKCKRGVIPMKLFVEPNKAKNCAHLVLTNDDITLTLSSVRSLEEFPRPAIFREQRASEQISLFGQDEWAESLYAILTHARKRRRNNENYPIVQLGIPNSAYSNWEELFGLHNLPQIIVTAEEKEEDIKSAMSLRDTIVKKIAKIDK